MESWLTYVSSFQYQMSEEEREERDQVMLKASHSFVYRMLKNIQPWMFSWYVLLLQQIQEMYFANPPIEPDLEFYKEVIRMLIKYNDRYVVSN